MTDSRVMVKQWSCSIIFLDTSSSILRRCSSNSILLLNSVSESAQFFCSNPSVSQLNSSAQTPSVVSSILQRVCSTLQRGCSTPSAGSFIFAYLLCEESRQWVVSFCILCEEFRYFVLCTLFKYVLCILY